MKKTTFVILAVWLVSLSAQGLFANRRHDRYPHRNSFPAYRYEQNYSRHSSRGVIREINRNERRIATLERRLYRLRSRGHLSFLFGRFRNSAEIRRIEWEISRLQARNLYLHGLLY